MSLPPRLIEGYETFRSGRLLAEQSRYRELAEHGQSPALLDRVDHYVRWLKDYAHA